MQKLERSDVWSLTEYERRRDDFRHRVIETKKRRRVQAGRLLSFVFENRDTVLFQVQEMLRAEHVADPERVQEELDIYNTMLPDAGELSATLFIEVTDPDRLVDEMVRLRGLNRSVYLEIDGQRVQGSFESGRAREDALSTVQYVRFHLNPEQVEALRAGKDQVALTVDHPRYQEKALLSQETRKSLASDLEG